MLVSHWMRLITQPLFPSSLIASRGTAEFFELARLEILHGTTKEDFFFFEFVWNWAWTKLKRVTINWRVCEELREELANKHSKYYGEQHFVSRQQSFCGETSKLEHVLSFLVGCVLHSLSWTSSYLVSFFCQGLLLNTCMWTSFEIYMSNNSVLGQGWNVL
jgi:hypothetical protein